MLNGFWNGPRTWRLLNVEELAGCYIAPCLCSATHVGVRRKNQLRSCGVCCIAVPFCISMTRRGDDQNVFHGAPCDAMADACRCLCPTINYEDWHDRHRTSIADMHFPIRDGEGSNCCYDERHGFHQFCCFPCECCCFWPCFWHRVARTSAEESAEWDARRAQTLAIIEEIGFQLVLTANPDPQDVDCDALDAAIQAAMGESEATKKLDEAGVESEAWRKAWLQAMEKLDEAQIHQDILVEAPCVLRMDRNIMGGV
jgi:hypothetical protein